MKEDSIASSVHGLLCRRTKRDIADHLGQHGKPTEVGSRGRLVRSFPVGDMRARLDGGHDLGVDLLKIWAAEEGASEAPSGDC